MPASNVKGFKGFTRGLADSLPVVAGYLPVAFSFGIAATQSGLSPALAALTSTVVFAGGSQFVLLGLLSAGGTLLAVVPTVLLINARHLLYAGPIVAQFPSGRRTLPAPLLAFGLTDEVMASAIGHIHRVAPEERERWYVGLQCGAYAAWVAGTWLGATLGARLPTGQPALQSALAFVLPALFLSLLLTMSWRRDHLPMLVSGAATALLLSWLPAHIVIPAAIVLGAACHAFFPLKRHD